MSTTRVTLYLLATGLSDEYKGGLAHTFRQVSGPDATIEEVKAAPTRAWAKGTGKKYTVSKYMGKGTPGTVYAVESDAGDPNVIYPSTAHAVTRWVRDDALVMGWAGSHENVERRAAAAAYSTKTEAYDVLREAAAPLRAMYRGAAGFNRTQLLAAIVAEVTR